MSYTIKQQYKYHCQQSKKGAVNFNGEKLSDFSRGVHLGKAKQIASNANLHKIVRKDKKTDFAQRKYDEKDIEKLFDSPGKINWK